MIDGVGKEVNVIQQSVAGFCLSAELSIVSLVYSQDPPD